MIHGPGKSDSPVVPVKSLNNTGPPVAEGMEGRGLAKGNPHQQHLPIGHRAGTGGLSALARVRQAAGRDRTIQFTALLHHVYHLDTLRAAFLSLKRNAAPGVDGETWRHYGEALEAHLQDLSARLKRGAYRAKPVRRVYIPKADGRQRPLGVTALEDTIVQRATVGEILSLTWTGVDLFRRTVTVFRSKNGERRTIPVNTTVLDLLKGKYAARRGMIDLVFHSESHTLLDGSNIRRALTTALDSAKIHDFHFHDLRHTFATRMVQAGIDLYKVQRLLGHKSPIMTQRYAHHYPESLRDGVDALEAGPVSFRIDVACASANKATVRPAH